MRKPKVTPIPTTPRKPLTKLQRSEMLKRFGGKCQRCKALIDPAKPFTDEHLIPLALGGSNDLKNRAPLCMVCADIKTKNEDMPRINKAKAQGAAVVSKDPDARSKLQSRGFEPKKESRYKIEKTPLPPRPIYK